MDEDFQRFLEGIESTPAQASMGLHLTLRARSRSALDNVVNAIRAQLSVQLELVESLKDSMKRRDLLRGVGVLGLPALLPAVAVREALTDPAHDQDRVHDLARLRSAVETLWRARQASHYDQLAALAPATLSALTWRNRHHDDAHALSSLAYQAIAGAMAKVGNSDLAWVAAERGIVEGKQSGSAVMMAAAERMYAHALLAQDSNAQAHQVAPDAADGMNLHDEPALAVYGACLNTAAIAAARLGATQAHDYLDEALQVAGHVGRDRNDLFTAFGVTNVGIHRVSVSVALGEGPRAVESAAVINPAALPAERRAHLLIDLAQAQEQDEEVAEALLTAEVVAPEEVRYNPAARALVAGLLRRRPSQVVRALAERIDVSA